MENILTELDSVNLIHSTCLTTTKHQLQQREILSHQPLIIGIDLDEIDDFIITPIEFNMTPQNSQSPSPSSFSKKRRFSSEINWHFTLSNNNIIQNNETLKENEEIVNSVPSSASSSPMLNSIKFSSSPLLQPINFNISSIKSQDVNKKRKRSMEDDDEEDEDEDDDDNNNNNNINNNNSNQNNNNLKKFQSKLHRTGSFITIPKFINLNNNSNSNNNNNKSTDIFNISKTMKDNIFNCLIKPIEHSLLVTP
ncbi:hypothetical protein DLAC_01635 [Tieghemostelium lacteum]|uniref:Uncharacterized protein n=1 Tax=Tieghemostelium lacteum TaxID=361077 RepID=A0A152A5Y6_TIELA|nr:hypothetical protein DLAC_01635 [Tieghemostelium lacteum]|eukprot:KYR01633.1 hypothetical protein DLAC_01635 [Tieghemostelium lacteum]